MNALYAATDALDERVARLVEKVRRVREARAICFGSRDHRFVFRTPLLEEEVASFETTHGIRLPEEYRRFLLCAGNGGAGPDYGILPLDKWDDALNIIPEIDGPLPADFLARAFHPYPGMPRTGDWAERLGIHQDQWFEGAIAVSTEGCTYYTLLVVSGPQRGRVVAIDMDGQPPSFHKEPDFLGWYERWIDRVLAALDAPVARPQVIGSEAGLAAAAVDPRWSVAHRTHFLSELQWQHALLPETVATVARCLDDSDPELRAAAVRLLGKHRAGKAYVD